MATKRPSVMGLRVRPEDWELFTKAAQLSGRTRNGLIVEGARLVATLALSGAISRQRDSADNAVVGPDVLSNPVAQRADLEAQEGSRSENNKTAPSDSAGPRSVANPSR